MLLIRCSSCLREIPAGSKILPSRRTVPSDRLRFHDFLFDVSGSEDGWFHRATVQDDMLIMEHACSEFCLLRIGEPKGRIIG